MKILSVKHCKFFSHIILAVLTFCMQPCVMLQFTVSIKEHVVIRTLLCLFAFFFRNNKMSVAGKYDR